MCRIGVFYMVLAFVLMSGSALMAQDWDSSPMNWNNSPLNWDNNSMNWKNSPMNWDNSPNRWGNERIIRDEHGRAQGYAVPKEDGGINFFDFDGQRRGYLPGR